MKLGEIQTKLMLLASSGQLKADMDVIVVNQSEYIIERCDVGDVKVNTKNKTLEIVVK